MKFIPRYIMPVFILGMLSMGVAESLGYSYSDDFNDYDSSYSSYHYAPHYSYSNRYRNNYYLRSVYRTYDDYSTYGRGRYSSSRYDDSDGYRVTYRPSYSNYYPTGYGAMYVRSGYGGNYVTVGGGHVTTGNYNSGYGSGYVTY